MKSLSLRFALLGILIRGCCLQTAAADQCGTSLRSSRMVQSHRKATPGKNEEGEQAPSNVGTLALNTVHTGHVTNYLTSDGSGRCNFQGMKLNMLRSGIGGNNWNGGLACGSCVRVKPSQGKEIEVYIVNETADGDGLDLELDSMIAMKGSTGGRIESTFEFVKCSFSEPIEVVLANSGPWDLRMTIRRTTLAVVVAEVQPLDGGEWFKLEKANQFHWTPVDNSASTRVSKSGGFHLRLTGVTGEKIVQRNLKRDTTEVQTGTVNF